MASTQQPLRGRDKRAADWEKRMRAEQESLKKRQREKMGR